MISERVRLAREATQLTQEQLAELTGLAQSTISAIEAGRVLSPSKDLIRSIADATQYPENFFYRGPLPDLPQGHYRRLRRGSASATRQVRAQVRQIVELVQLAETALRLPPISLEPQRSLFDLEAIESVAADTRRAIGVGESEPIPNLTRAVERAGVIVVRFPFQIPSHDSFSVWPDYGLDGRPVIAMTSGHSGDRDRFNVAHELGHLLLHTLRSNTDPAVAEHEAHRFAGALLLPSAAAGEAMRRPVTLRILMAVKATYGVSMGVAAKRALDLGLISRDQFVSIRRQLSARGWTKEEPVDVVPEAPMLISKIVSFLAGAGPTSKRASRLAMPVFSFTALAAANGANTGR